MARQPIIYYCPTCKKVWSNEGYAVKCNCGGNLISSGIPAEQWRLFPEQEKERIKSQLDQKAQEALLENANYPAMPKTNMELQVLNKIAHDLHFIYIVTLINVIISLASIGGVIYAFARLVSLVSKMY